MELWHAFIGKLLLKLAGASQSGALSSGKAVAAVEGGWGGTILATLLGMFAGMILGYMLSNILRFAAYARGEQLTGYKWVIYGTLAGAVIGGWLSMNA